MPLVPTLEQNSCWETQINVPMRLTNTVHALNSVIGHGNQNTKFMQEHCIIIVAKWGACLYTTAAATGVLYSLR